MNVLKNRITVIGFSYGFLEPEREVR